MGGEVHAQSPAGQEVHARAVGQAVQKHQSVVCICAECKKVITVVGEVTPASTPLVSHGICPECAHILYGHLFRRPPER